SLQAKLHQRTPLPEPFGKIVGRNPQFVKALEMAARVVATDAPVLIQGESGVGKEVLARAIHESSPRAQGPFVKINCAAIPDQLLESELFGYEEGAFTGARRGGKRGKLEVAHKGTLLLDEIGDMNLTMQAKLLRVLQEKEFERLGGNRPIKVDVRFIAATNRDLHQLILNKQFREDLYYRLNVMPITIPPLRERKDDIGMLTRHYLKQLGEKYGRILTCSSSTMDIFYSYSWPGNVRELQNVLEHATIMCPDNLIMPEHLPAYLRNRLPATFLQERSSLNLKTLLAEIEEKAIRTALEIANNNKTKAIALLGLSRRAFYQKLRKYNIGV
ncbi:MAG: sigma 54-interacting transcriptional regulator, partial [Clostridia bacterium]|nr:sigma 54-interacting transcriptional regulator [Clostridia bacterium]